MGHEIGKLRVWIVSEYEEVLAYRAELPTRHSLITPYTLNKE